VSLHIGACWGTWGGGSVYHKLRERDEGGSRNGASLSQSLKRLTVEGLEGRLLYWVPLVMRGRLWGWVSLFMGGPTYGSSVKGTRREGSLAGDPGG